MNMTIKEKESKLIKSWERIEAEETFVKSA